MMIIVGWRVPLVFVVMIQYLFMSLFSPSSNGSKECHLLQCLLIYFVDCFLFSVPALIESALFIFYGGSIVVQ